MSALPNGKGTIRPCGGVADAVGLCVLQYRQSYVGIGSGIAASRHQCQPKDSTGTITVHINEKLEAQRTKSRGMMRFRVVKLPNPEVWLGYVHDGDSIALKDLLNNSYLQVKAEFVDFNFPLDSPEVLSFEINRSESFRQPVEVTGNKLPQSAREMLSEARLDETVYLDNIKVLLPDGRTVTLHAQFPLK